MKTKNQKKESTKQIEEAEDNEEIEIMDAAHVEIEERHVSMIMTVMSTIDNTNTGHCSEIFRPKNPTMSV